MGCRFDAHISGQGKGFASLRRWHVALHLFGAGAKEELLHLAGQVLAGALVSQVQAVLIDQSGADLMNARRLLRGAIPIGSVVIYHNNVRPYPGVLGEGTGQCRARTLSAANSTQTGSVVSEGAIDRFFGKRVDFAVLGQTRLGSPPNVVVCEGMQFDLVSDCWTQERYTILGVGMPRFKPGLGFAVYKRFPFTNEVPK